MPMLLRNLMGSGAPPQMASVMAGDITDNQTATGTTQATALVTGTAIIRCTTVASGTGVILNNGIRGDSQVIVNDGASTLLVYPPVGHTIEANGTNIPFSVRSGSWAQFERITNTKWIVDNAEEQFVVSFEDFGAVGDGVTDDSTAINLAMAWLRSNVSTSVVPLGFTYGVYGTAGKIYRVNSSINATGIIANNWFVDLRGAMILGRCTGTPVWDMLGSRFGRIYAMNIYGHATDKPTYGIQMGRVTTGSMGEFTFIDLRMDGFFTKACYYNYAGEICSFLHPQLFNRDTTAGAYGYILDAMNQQNITSAFITQTNPQGTAQSCNENTFMDGDIRCEVGGIPCMRLIGNFSQFRYQGYVASSAGTAIEIYKSTAIKNFELDIHIETTGLNKCITFDTVDASSNVVVTSFKFRDHAPVAATAILDTTGTTRTIVFDGAQITLGIPVGTPIFFGSSSGAAAKVIIDGTIEWLGNTTLDLSNVSFDGTIVTRGTTEVSITNTVGCYDIVRRPDSAASRLHYHKGQLRILGTNAGTSPTDYVELAGGNAAAGTVTLTAGSDTTTDVTLALVPQGIGTINLAGGPVKVSSTTGISAAGTTQGTATLLTTAYNGITTAAANSGVLLKTGVAGESQSVYNGGANPVKVYPPTGAHINQLAANAAHVLAVNTSCEYRFFSTTLVVGILSA